MGSPTVSARARLSRIRGAERRYDWDGSRREVGDNTVHSAHATAGRGLTLKTDLLDWYKIDKLVGAVCTDASHAPEE